MFVDGIINGMVELSFESFNVKWESDVTVRPGLTDCIGKSDILVVEDSPKDPEDKPPEAEANESLSSQIFK
jgi:hypothetical protein